MYYNKHYITTNTRGLIVDGWSNGPHPEKNIIGAICINEHGGYQFRLSPDGEENPPLYTMDGIPLYKYVNGEIIARTDTEIAADRAALSEPPPTAQEQLRADIDFIAAMQGVTL